MSISDLIKANQASMPASSFTQDMSSAVGLKNQFPQTAFNGVVNNMMTDQINNTSADQASFPDAADQFEANGLSSMTGAVDALHEGNAIDAVHPDTWGAMSQMSPNISESLGFDPATLQANPELAQQTVADSRGQNNSPSQAQTIAQNGVDAARDGAKAAKKFNAADAIEDGVGAAVDGEGKIMSTEMNVAGDVAKGAVKTEGKVLGTEAKVAGSVASEGADIASKGLTALGDLAKSPVGKIAGKAALPLAVVGGAVSMAQDAGTFGDALTDPFDSKKRDKAVKALREDSPIPGTPLVLDALTDPGKIADTAKDVGKVFTHPGLDSLKDAGKSIADELGF